MNIKVRTFSAFMALSLFVGMTMVGCKKEEVKEDVDAELKKDVQLCDFEDWNVEFNNILPFNDFGKVSLNRDEKYIKKGTGSARIDPLGGKYSSSYPYVSFSTKSSLYDYSNFSYADYISFDIYNDNNEEKTIYAGLIDNIDNITIATRINEKAIKLDTGWNSCKLPIEKDLLTILGSINDISGFYLRFDPAYSSDIIEEGENKTPRYYLDNVCIKKSPIKTEEGLKIDLKENEISDFETLYQQYMFYSDYNIKFKIVNAEDNNLLAPSGNNILKVELPGNGVNNGNWNHFTISPKLLKASKLGALDNETGRKAYFCFDVYNDTDKRMSASVLYKSSSNDSIRDTTLNNVPKKWATYEYSVGDLLKSDPNYLTKIGDIRIYYKANYDGIKVMYLDNFRIEMR